MKDKKALNEGIGIPEFGERIQNQQYVARPGSYALITDTRGYLAVMETPRGCYLPGGGSEGSETPEETLVREVREECGFDVAIVRRIGEAIEYVYTPGNDAGIRKECVFLEATVATGRGAATEADHVLVWLEPQEAEARLAHGSQRWAVHEGQSTD